MKKQSRIEKWYIRNLIYEMEHPSLPNLILGIFGIYYLLKWKLKDEE